MLAPASAASRGIGILAAVGETVGRGVDDAHHLRLVEADRPLAQHQRRARRGQPRPVRRHRPRRTALRSPRPAPVRARAVAVDQFDRGEPVEPARQPRDLAVMAERGIDEAGRAEKRAHARLTARRDAAAARRRSAASRPSSSTCQKVQPLHDGAPCKLGADLVDRARVRRRMRSSRRRRPSRSSGAWRRSAASPARPSRSRPAARTPRAAPSACRPSPSSRFRRAAASRRSAPRATLA